MALTRKARSGGARSGAAGLPLMHGVPERRTHNYVRHGTTSLFAALDIASGFVIGKCYKRHRAAGVLELPPADRCSRRRRARVHIVMDNYATHKTPKIKAWLARRPHYHVHYTPTSASRWINQVERWFAELTTTTGAAFIPQSGSSRPTSAPSSTGTTKSLSKWGQISRPNPRFGQTLLPQNPADVMPRTLDSRD